MATNGETNGETNGGDVGYDAEAAYNAFPPGDELGYGPDQGFNVKRRVNDARLFTEEALADPVIAEFVKLPFDVCYLQTKSSTREAEWFLHKPHRVLSGEVPEIEIDVSDGRFRDPGHIVSLFLNHERTMARWKQSVILTQDGNETGAVSYKQNEKP